MTEQVIGKAVIQAEVDGSGVDAGVAVAKRHLADLGTSARAAGQAGAAGLAAIGTGAEQAGGKVDVATKRIISAVQQQTAAVAAGAKGNADYFASIANQRGANLQVLGPYLQQLTEAETKAKAAAAAQRQLTEGRDFIAGLEARANSIGKTASQLAELKAAQLGVTAQAAPLIARLRDAERPLGQLGVTGAQTAQQLRQVAPQVTDIVTQLAAGQSPMLIAIQQGGQLKDVFGGVGNAAKALGGYLLTLITPLTVAAATLAGIAYAYYRGSQESKQFTDLIVLQGNSAGVTTSQLRGMAQAMAAAGNGTQGAAVDALTTMASEGRVAGDQLLRLTTIASQLDRAVGKPLADTAKEFASLKDAPVEASLRLTQQYNYLTQSVYNQIKALKDQGRETDAARLAQDTFAGAMESRLPALTANVGLLGKAWQGLTGFIKGAGDAMASIGRSPELQQQLQAAQRNAASLLDQIASREDRGLATGNLAEKAAAAQSLVDSLREQLKMGEAVAVQSAAQVKSVEAQAKWDALVEASLTKQEKLQRALAIVRETAKKAGLSELETEQQLARTRAQYAETDPFNAGIETLKQNLALRELLHRDSIEKIQSTYRLGAISQLQSIELVSNADVAQLEAERANLVERIAVAGKKKDSLREIAELQGQVALKDQQILQRQGKTGREIAEVRYQALLRETLALESQRDQDEKDKAAEAVAADQRWTSALGALQDYQRAVDDDKNDLEYQVSLIGKTGRALAIANEQRSIELALRKQLRDIDDRSKGGNLTNTQVEEARATARKTAAQASAQAETKVYIDEWTRANNTIADGLYEALTSSGESARKKLVRLFADMVLRPRIIAGLQGVSGSLASLVTGGGGSGALGAANVLGGGSSGILGSLGGLGNIGSTLGFGTGSSMFTQFATSGIGNALGLSTTVDAIGGLGTASTALTGAGSAFAAALPWVAGALAVASLFSGKGGGPKDIGSYGSGNLGQDYVRGDTAAQFNTGAKAIVDGIQGSYLTAAKSLGITAGDLQSGALFAIDNKKKGDSPTALTTQTYLNGKLVYDRNNALGGGNYEDVGRSPEELEAAITLASARAVLSALKASELPAQLATYFDTLDPLALNAEQIAAAIETARVAQQFAASMGSLGDGLGKIASLSVLATTELIGAAGGLDKLSASINTAYEILYTEDERNANLLGAVQKQMTALGHASVDTLPELRALIEGIDPVDDASRTLLLSLLQLAPAFKQVYSNVQTLLDQLNNGAISYFNVLDNQAQRADLRQQGVAGINAFLGEAAAVQAGLFDGQITAAQAASAAAATAASNWASVADSVRSTLGSLQVESAQLARSSFATLYDQFKALTTLARGGDASAAARLSDAARLAVDASGRKALTLVDYLRDRARIERSLSETLSTAEVQVSVQQTIRDAAQAQVTQLQALNVKLDGFSASLLEVLNKGYVGADRGTADSISGLLAAMTADFASFFSQYKEGESVTGAGGAKFTRLSGANAAFTDAAGNTSYFRQSDSIVDLAKRNPALRAYWEQQYGIRLPSFSIGTNLIPRDMIAQLHEGEAVVPKAFNPAAHGNAGVWTDPRAQDLQREQVGLLQGVLGRLTTIEKRISDVERRTFDWERNGLGIVNATGTTLATTP